MPARSNPFQQVVALLHQQYSNAKVTESKALQDLATGDFREVDVVVETKIDDYPIVLSVECLDSARPATVEWVERMYGKHSTLPTNKLALISRSGFTKSALKKALWFKHEALALDQLEGFDWTTLVGKQRVLELESVALSYQAELVAESPNGDEILKPVPADLLLQEEGTGRCLVLGPFVERCLRLPEVGAIALDHLRDVASVEGPYHICVDFPVPMLFTGPAGDSRRTRLLRVGLVAKKAEFQVPVSTGIIKDTPVAFGESQRDGVPLRVAIVEKQGAAPIVEVTQRAEGGQWATLVNADGKTPGIVMTRNWPGEPGTVGKPKR